MRPIKNYCVTIPAVQLSSEPPSPKIRKLVPPPPSLRSLPDGTNPYSLFINVSVGFNETCRLESINQIEACKCLHYVMNLIHMIKI